LISIKAAPRDIEINGIMFRHPLAREIAVIVAVKTAIIVAAGLLVFGPHRLLVTSSTVEAHVLQFTSGE
jgi:hypothetical protein